MFDVIIVGAGFAGATLAHKFKQDGKKVLIIEKRAQIAGNMYDYLDENKALYHQYGPHIFHTENMEVVEYLSQFTQWFDYEHKVSGYVQGKLVPIPFNLTSIEMVFDKEKADRLKALLLESYEEGSKVPILKLKGNENAEIHELAEFIYEHVFKYYTMKQWGLTPEEIDPAVTGRVPVMVGYDDRYFQNKFQKMPKEGYTKIFEKMLEGIEVLLNTECRDVIEIIDDQIYFNGELFEGKFIYTGVVDDLMNYRHGHLPYRSLSFDKQTHEWDYQPNTTVNYPTSASIHPYTRITEYKKMMYQPSKDKTTIAVEYPKAYTPNTEDIPYYPIFTEENQRKYNVYVEECKKVKNLYLIGRLAEYRYYDMDAIIARALSLYEEIK